ncbi:posphoenolpyruvate synthetase regulatory kinase/phosphorylase PpsR [Sansalvadorimonas verongulae]|uniref:posphoenolpyruvate synthetase regulatory kinase/phosphorylase PpsR n=1 Tax=Sansalvadorimonas verongulae TaxID=2172824 RepID=UPI0012BBBE70|nr:pyruvate, water dikinase regulatory protein [Sansalvadorimonas verongulae]MTI13326.1 kinase/pyrophosphorylase [Sansalvadorimonas verongulae]
MNEQKRTTSVFFVSDGTGITAESFGQSLLAQFEHIEFEKVTLPYIDTLEKAQEVVGEITRVSQQGGPQPLLFSTIIDEAIADMIRSAPAYHADIFDTYMPSLERQLNAHASHQVGKKRSIHGAAHKYNQRIDAVHFAIENDDGAKTRFYDDADIIIVGVSRCGKTPTCLYMGLQFGIQAANYPITEDDLDMMRLPKVLKPHKSKLFGLTISPERLAAIRHERRPNSRYASPRQCALELEEVAQMFQQNNIPFLDTTHYSVEEISTRVIAQAGIERRVK